MYSVQDLHKGGVSPFGHPRINDRSHLPAAYRSVPRPSSPLGAKASTERPSHTQLSNARTQDASAILLRITSPTSMSNRTPANTETLTSHDSQSCELTLDITILLHHEKQHGIRRSPGTGPEPQRGFPEAPPAHPKMRGGILTFTWRLSDSNR